MPGGRAARRPVVTRQARVRYPPWQLGDPMRRRGDTPPQHHPARRRCSLQAGRGKSRHCSAHHTVHGSHCARHTRGRRPTARMPARHTGDESSNLSDHTHAPVRSCRQDARFVLERQWVRVPPPALFDGDRRRSGGRHSPWAPGCGPGGSRFESGRSHQRGHTDQRGLIRLRAPVPLPPGSQADLLRSDPLRRTGFLLARGATGNRLSQDRSNRSSPFAWSTDRNANSASHLQH